MKPTQWLMRAAPGFDRLSTEERKAIADFSLLWSFFEGTILDTEGSADRIIDYVRSLNTLGTLTLKPFQEVIRYYSKRYYDGAQFTPEFYELHLRASDHRSLVEKVVQGRSTDDVEILSAVLIIILRLRNNLFHGVKWSYSIQGQLENFRNANSVLMSVIDLRRA